MKRKYLLLLTPVSILFLLLAKNIPFLAEYIFARGTFKIASIPVGFLSSLVPFSIAELLLYSLPVIFLVLLIRFIYLMLHPGRIAVLKRWGTNLGITLSIMLFLFTILCGTNYYRYEFENFCDFKTSEYPVSQLYELCVYLAEQSNSAKEESTQTNPVPFSTVSKDAKKAFKKIQKQYPVLRYSTGRAKPVLASHLMSYTGIVGIYVPFTVEANVNTDIADYNHPFDTCHELAHLHGFMRENEENFIAYLACIQSDDAYFRYSGYMTALIYATNALYDEDTKLYMQISALLSDEVHADLHEEDIYWEKIRTTKAYQTVETASDKVNDTYLKINGQSDGVKSYGKIVDLLLAEYFAR